MEEENEYEAARLRQIAANKAKLQSLGVSAAVEAVAAPLKVRRDQAAAAKRAKHAAASGSAAPAQRRASGRAAAADARSKLREQTVDSASGSGGESSESHSQSRSEASGDMESDVSVVSDATEDEVTSSGLLEGQPDAAHPSHHATRPFKHRSSSRRKSSSSARCVDACEDQDEELQQALQLSLADAAHPPHPSVRSAPERRKVTSEDAPAVSSPAIDPSDLKQPKNVSQPDSSAANVSNPPPGKSASKKKSKAGKMGRSAPAPPTDAELSAVFSMLNPKGMSAIIGSDIKQVASEVLLIEHEPEQLQNMMVRACEVLGLQQQRLEPEAFLELARHYLG